jgi:hypothetical protein
VLPPTPPPVNPAPPGGSAARKEAKQRQAASAKSESAGDTAGASGDAHGNIDSAQDPGASMTRLDHRQLDFTAIEHREQASDWVRDAGYAGGLLGIAGLFAGGWMIGRPRPRRRDDPRPAPAWLRVRR